MSPFNLGLLKGSAQTGQTCIFTLTHRKPMILKSLLFILITLVLTGCSTTKSVAENPDAKTPPSSAKVSYSKGAATSQSSYDLALLHLKTLREGKFNLDQQAYERGLQDALNGKELIDVPDQHSAQTAWKTLSTISYEESKTANLAIGKAFLEQNKTRKGVITLPSGVQYEVLQQGKGPHKPTLNDSVGIIYKIAGIDGTVKIDYMTKGNQKMFEIPMQKIYSKGWQEALQLMNLESKWRLYIPGELAFGEKGLSEKDIMPNETLMIDNLLLDIKLSP
jgi:FKBP-type peptidyl-prolyl cis-trans isomerase FklB